MTVQELIEKLQSHPPEMLVVVDGYEGGFEDPVLKTKTVSFKKEYPYGGSHSEASEAFPEDDEGFLVAPALVVSRNDF